MEKKLLIISICAALLSCVADVLLLYSPLGNYHTGDYAFLKDIPLERMMWGHYLGILLIPFELLGIGVVINSFHKINIQKKIVAMAACIFVLTVGVAYHGMIIFVASAIQQNGIESAQELKYYFEPFGAILGILFVVLTILFIHGIHKRWTWLPKKIVAFNPAFIYILLIIIYLIFPPLGNILIVAGFNLAIAVFLIAVYFNLKTKSFSSSLNK